MFVLRAAFWLTVVAFILPIAASSPDPMRSNVHSSVHSAALSAPMATSDPEVPDVGARDLLAIAGRSAEDVLGFCDRNPDVCAQSRAVARHVARQIYHYGGRLITWLAAEINEQPAETTVAPASEAPSLPYASEAFPSEA